MGPVILLPEYIYAEFLGADTFQSHEITGFEGRLAPEESPK